MELTGRRIALLKGGPGSERAVSLETAKGVGAALREMGAEVEEVDVVGPDFALGEGCEVAFNVIHGTFGEDGGLQAVLEERGVAYTGAGSASSGLAFDKGRSKAAFVAAGVPTPEYQIVELGEAGEEALRLELPLVLKPLCEGSSVGVHIVREASGVAAALADLGRFGRRALVERFVAGKELTVGILGGEVLPVIEIKPRSGFYDIANKYPWMGGTGGSEYLCPAELDAETTARVQAAALAAHRALGVEVYSRVDVLLDAAGQPQVLEVNTIPGMTSTSLLPKAAAAAGIGYGALCARILELSLKEKR